MKPSFTSLWSGRGRACARLIGLVVCLALGGGGVVYAQNGLSEAEVKAAFVFNFARLVEWPRRAFLAADSPLVICLLGRDPIEGALPALETKRVKERRVEVRSIAGIDDALACHVVYIGASETRRLAPMLHSLGGRPVLTISDAEAFIDLGGAIGLVYDDNRLQFDINRQTLVQAQLAASSSLLKLARTLIDAKK